MHDSKYGHFSFGGILTFPIGLRKGVSVGFPIGSHFRFSVTVDLGITLDFVYFYPVFSIAVIRTYWSYISPISVFGDNVCSCNCCSLEVFKLEMTDVQEGYYRQERNEVEF